MQLQGALVLLLTYLSTANIVFHRVEPTCNFSDLTQSSCLRGQSCLTNGTCAADDEMPFNSFETLRRITSIMGQHITSVMSRQVVREDGRCGTGFEGAVCPGINGTCCSTDGYVHDFITKTTLLTRKDSVATQTGIASPIKDVSWVAHQARPSYHHRQQIRPQLRPRYRTSP